MPAKVAEENLKSVFLLAAFCLAFDLREELRRIDAVCEQLQSSEPDVGP